MSLHNYTRPDKVRITKNFINGEFVDGSDHTFIDVINPATEEVVAKVAEGTAKDIERAIDAAHQALPKWRETPMRDRC
jgi:acyl-CoA reductase-like NAD-dependent aldehyde dehydrogenase